MLLLFHLHRLVVNCRCFNDIDNRNKCSKRKQRVDESNNVLIELKEQSSPLFVVAENDNSKENDCHPNIANVESLTCVTDRVI